MEVFIIAGGGLKGGDVRSVTGLSEEMLPGEVTAELCL